MSESFRKRMLTGVSWTAAGQMFVQATTFVTSLVLARLLAPAVFGVMGMANLYVGLVTMLGEVGLGAALIQRRDVDDEQVSTVFWTGLAIASLLCAATIAASPVAARFFREPVVAGVIRGVSFTFVLQSLGSVNRVMLTRDMDFRAIARAEVASIAAYALTVVAMALAGAGVWSMVAGYLVRAGVEALALWRARGWWRPRLTFSVASFRSLIGFGGSVWLFNAFNYARENVDYLVIGRQLGSTQLGFYTLAYNLANLPRRQLSSILGRVSFPAFSRVQDDDALLRSTYVRIVRSVSLLAFPLLVGLAVLAPQLVPLMYGQRWASSVVPLQMLALAGMLYSVGSTVGPVCMAKGRPDIQMKVGVVAFVVLAVLVVPLVRFGIGGVAAGVLGYTVVSLLVGQAFANRLIGLRMRAFLGAMTPAAIASAAMAVGLVGYRIAALGPRALSGAVWLASAIVLGALLYAAVLALLRVEELPYARRLLGRGLRSLRARRPAVTPGAEGGGA